MLDSFYQMALKSNNHHILVMKTSRFCHPLHNVIKDVIT